MAMDEEWAEAERQETSPKTVTVSLTAAKAVRGYIMGDAFDANLIEEFLRAVEKVDPNQ